jgi:hypothetical protein
MAIQISGTNVIDNSCNIVNGVNVAASGNITGDIVATQAEAEAGTNNDQIMTPLRVKQFFDVQVPPLPPISYEGGFLLSKGGGTALIVAPSNAQVCRTWYLREDANTLANTCTSCTGWFVPTMTQLQNPGYVRRIFWDSFSSTCYWSNTEQTLTFGCGLHFGFGISFATNKTSYFAVRSFRCVTY